MLSSTISWSDVVYQILNIIVPLAITGIGSGITWLISKIYKNYHNNSLLTTLSSTIKSVVLEVYQTYVEALKKENVFDEEAQQTALSSALNKLLSILPSETLELIETLFGDTKSYLTTQIESEIALHKTTLTSTTPIESVVVENIEPEISPYEEITINEDDTAVVEPTSEVVVDDSDSSST